MNVLPKLPISALLDSRNARESWHMSGIMSEFIRPLNFYK
jgi:hypothetical protein